MTRRRKHWGWGYEDERPSAAELRESAATFASILGFGATEPEAPKQATILPWVGLGAAGVSGTF